MQLSRDGWRRRSPNARALALVLLAVFAGGLLPSAAANADVDSGDSVWIGSLVGYGGTGIFPIHTETPADPADPGETDYYAYCIEHAMPAETRLEGLVGDVQSYLGANYFPDPGVQGKVLWVLAHSYPALSLQEFGTAAGVPGISRDDAIEATQYALWRYTELTWDAPWAWETADSEAAYWYLLNGANSSPGMVPEDFEVTVSVDAPTAQQTAESLVGPFVVHTGLPMVSVAVDPAAPITDAAGTPIDADAVTDGQEIFVDQRGTSAGGSATVTVSARGSGSTGKIISVPTTPGGTPVPGDHAQTIILVASDAKRTAVQASVQWNAVDGAVPVIGTSGRPGGGPAPVTDTPLGPGDGSGGAELAETGAATNPGMVAAGGFALVAGAVLLLLGRRTERAAQ